MIFLLLLNSSIASIRQEDNVQAPAPFEAPIETLKAPRDSDEGIRLDIVRVVPADVPVQPLGRPGSPVAQ